jgi:hypothetical protein
MNLHFLDDDIIDSDSDDNHIAITINQEINTYNTIPTNPYWYDRIINYINNTIYYDSNQITNSQYHRIMDFLQHFC